MNDTKKLDVETCIDALKVAVLDVLAKAKQEGYRLNVVGVSNRTGITNQFPGDESKKMSTPFTRALLIKLTEEAFIEPNVQEIDMIVGKLPT